MLVACTSCHHQYDVGDLPAGAKIHCHCGIFVRVPEFKPRDAKIMHCSGCGAHLDAGVDACGYCRATVVRSEHNFGPACPECFSRMVDAAKFCSTCGVQITAEKVQTKNINQKCPRCDAMLVGRTVKNGSFSECTDCGGLWLVEGTFDELVLERDQEAVGAFLQISTNVERKRTVMDEELNSVRYMKCPTCSQLMNRRNFGSASGVIIDTCKGHGAWFDVFELEAVLEFVQKGGLDKARERKLEEQQRKADLASERARSTSYLSDGHVVGGSGWSNSRGFRGPDLFDVIGWIAGKIFKK